MTKQTKSIIQLADEAYASADRVSLLRLTGEATTPEEAHYVTALVVRTDDVATTDGTVARVQRQADIGAALRTEAKARYNAGLVKGKDDKPIIPSSDDLVSPDLAFVLTGLGVVRGERHQVAEARFMAYTDLQRAWQADRASADDIENGIAEVEADPKKSVTNLAHVIGAIASATYKRTDYTGWAKKRTDQANRATVAEQAKAMANDEAKSLAAIEPSASPVVIDEAWSWEQCHAAIKALTVRAGEIRKAEAEAKANEAKRTEAEATMAEAMGVTVDVLRTLMAEAKAKAEATA